MSLQTLWPFPGREIEKLSRQVKTLLVPELNRGQLLTEVRRYACGEVEVVPINRYDGRMIPPGQIEEELNLWLK